jgi:hypothetical protein
MMPPMRHRAKPQPDAVIRDIKRLVDELSDMAMVGRLERELADSRRLLTGLVVQLGGDVVITDATLTDVPYDAQLVLTPADEGIRVRVEHGSADVVYRV